MEIKSLTLAHKDDRRLIYEAEFSNGNSVEEIIVKDETAVLGNHYHKIRKEIFYIKSGMGILMTQHIGNDGKPEGIKEQKSFQMGDAFPIDPMVAHTICNCTPGTALIIFSSAHFDAGDLHPYKLV